MRLRPPPLLVYALARGLLHSLHVHHYGTGNLLNGARSSATGSLIACYWHQSLLSLVAAFQDTKLKVATLASRSGDGEIITSYLNRVGIRPVRGSSARGASAAAREIMEALAEGWHVAIAVDGPRGPAQVVKTGPLEVARRNGVTVIPVAARASREIEFARSWDRFRVPLPGSHVALVYGQPIRYPEGEPTAAELAGRAEDMRARLMRAEVEADRLVRRFANARRSPTPSAGFFARAQPSRDAEERRS